MNLLASLKRPEYLFRPTQIFRRLRCEFSSKSAEYETVRLPWGLPLRIHPDEALGSVVRRVGIHELAVCECISRLIDPGEIALDVGANIGQMTSIMAMSAGPGGKVIAFEPHPILLRELQFNIAAWEKNPKAAPITVHSMALSNHSGVAQLVVPPDFDHDHGVSFLVENSDAKLQGQCYEVPVGTLDGAIEEGTKISFLKMDVEGHEVAVLNGAQRSLASGNIRDILFEEYQMPPTPTTSLLEQSGYTLFRVGWELFGPILRSPGIPHANALKEPPNYLATRDPNRALERISKRGWRVLGNRW